MSCFRQGDGLLLYMDDGGYFDFIEVKLVSGALRCRFNLGEGAETLSLGRDLDDGAWHRSVRKSKAITPKQPITYIEELTKYGAVKV